MEILNQLHPPRNNHNQHKYKRGIKNSGYPDLMVCPLLGDVQKVEESNELENEFEKSREKEETKCHALRNAKLTTR